MALFRKTTGDKSEKPGVFARLGERLAATRRALSGNVSSLLGRKRTLDAALLEDLETALITADLGVDTASAVMADITRRVSRKELGDTEAVYAALRTILYEIVAPCEQPWPITHQPEIVLMIGVNGAGKTTTIGKLAVRLRAEGRSVLLAAGDTFRAAAIEQLGEWARRAEVAMISQPRGADAAAVAHDALQAARARAVDVLLIDSAGRLHTQTGLMDELAKIKRTLARLDARAPHQVLLILDGGIGQNALAQVEQFHKAVGVTGLCITKLDGTAKGGVVFALAKRFALPIYFVGVGESADDLRPFDARSFVDAVLPAELVDDRA
ncbi:signal recognition particle-docking protein FtsY [Acidiferrobacter thiooxydans]|jgi:fused signal recognition particle receptor|uniref:Signal recognition particle receptor FtsY n=1 Tax=Acidiferrobacter thiooxydans TaxID=163359 RepID=A0A1C2FZM1_9GAMM|nr:signal recognition particle-docking protein FtsY [Acidiferrobacter thiooxydans]RCN58534.1 signal recognition particle-docking protein FtsY [Acidiferrobacter thiooxydans]UEO00144.1 signal recognition particle-docking protein FtsY [Acidiferrobacter thiooxydans]